MNKSTINGNKHNNLNSIEKAIKVLLKFQKSGATHGIRELSNELGFSPATVQRILKTLKQHDFVRQDSDTRQYYIGNIFYSFIQALNRSNNLTSIARKYIEELAIKTRETAHINIIEEEHRLCIDTIESSQTLKAGMPMGHRSPLYAGASAKCLLAFSSPDYIKDYIEERVLEPVTDNTISTVKDLEEELDKIKINGFAKSLGERTPGLGSLSTPIFDNKGIVLASLSLAIPEIRFSENEYLDECINILTNVAKAFSESMGYSIGRPIN
ncbi:MAG: IclR family transcriptional regulator [Desulfobacteraceae bacterium]|nr:IclR family transcriptional regulator [Desulfobacteraceae bacterium]